MFHRLYSILVLALWLGSTTWLVVEKVLPPLLGGTPPDYQTRLEAESRAPDIWKITWQDQTFGFAATQAYCHPGGLRELRSVVQIEDAPIETMISQALGVWSKWMEPLFGPGGEFRVNMLVGTRVWFDASSRLSRFRSALDLGENAANLRIEGEIVAGGKLDVTARMDDPASRGSSNQPPLFHQQIELPSNGLVSDAFTPRSELKHLRVGQMWTVPVYRPFPPNSPVQILAVKVERHDIIIWEGRDVETMLLVYRSEAGSGLSSAREPIAMEWVRHDGTVLRQEISLSGLKLVFERLPNEPTDSRVELLDPAKHPALWGRDTDAP